MRFRIYIDESGTNADDWLIIGALFVPDHGTLHSALCAAKERLKYFNQAAGFKARYKETHFAKFRNYRDVAVAKLWIDAFLQHSCYYRSIVIDWSVWDGRHFGDAFDPEALKRRRAYKKWTEMLLHPELKSPTSGKDVHHARLILDRLRIVHGYEVLDYLKDRFTANYQGLAPHIETFEPADSRRDANLCLQLCDLLTGCMYQALVPATKRVKLDTRDYLAKNCRRSE